MDPLPPIPTPPAQRWREFRIQILPLIVFVVVVAVVAILWTSFVQPVGVIGEVEAVKANVTSLEDGLLVELTVDLLDQVTAGQVIGRVQLKSPEGINAELAALEAELRITGVRTVIDERRRTQDLEQLRMSLRDQEAELAADRSQLPQASNNFFRVRTVYLEGNGIFTADEYDVAEAELERLKALVEARTKLVEQLSKALDGMVEAEPIDIQSVVDNAIRRQREDLEHIYAPFVLRAPIDGTVSALYRRSGERVLGGEPLLTISAPRASRIIGYVRQPVGTPPTTNDTVLVTTRGQPRRKGEGQILRVGSQLEMVRPGVMSQDNNRIDMGLPILVSLPSGLGVIPGELVDLSIRYAKN